MIACEGVRELAQAYLEGELEPADRERLERHLHACPTCRQVVASYRQLFAVLAEPALPPVPPGLAASVLARAEAAARRRRAWQALALAAALFVVGGAGALLAWGGLPGDLAAVGEVAPSLHAWQSTWDSAIHFAQGVAAAGSDWVSMFPGGLPALGLLLVGLGAQFLLAYRWRALARLDNSKQARVMQ